MSLTVVLRGTAQVERIIAWTRTSAGLAYRVVP
jgi:hypothetical protein